MEGMVRAAAGLDVVIFILFGIGWVVFQVLRFNARRPGMSPPRPAPAPPYPTPPRPPVERTPEDDLREFLEQLAGRPAAAPRPPRPAHARRAAAVAPPQPPPAHPPPEPEIAAPAIPRSPFLRAAVRSPVATLPRVGIGLMTAIRQHSGSQAPVPRYRFGGAAGVRAAFMARVVLGPPRGLDPQVWERDRI
jgi:hypothetical protein